MKIFLEENKEKKWLDDGSWHHFQDPAYQVYHAMERDMS